VPWARRARWAQSGAWSQGNFGSHMLERGERGERTTTLSCMCDEPHATGEMLDTADACAADNIVALYMRQTPPSLRPV
jgi:hypothetical protein